jgi:hypothetical protein
VGNKMPAPFNEKASVFGAASLFLVCVCSALAGLATAPELTKPKPGGLYRCGPLFTIADLDGDHQPDLALVQIVGYGSPNGKYSIRFEFSQGPRVAVGIEAPLGGLRIDSRDVNGDHRNDLILSTLAESEVVAVLLNQGGGNFVVAKPGLFPNLGRNQMRVVHAFGTQMDDELMLLQNRAAFGEETIAAAGRNLGVGSYLVPQVRGGLLQRPTHVRFGRSPPDVVSA